MTLTPLTSTLCVMWVVAVHQSAKFEICSPLQSNNVAVFRLTGTIGLMILTSHLQMDSLVTRDMGNSPAFIAKDLSFSTCAKIRDGRTDGQTAETTTNPQLTRGGSGQENPGARPRQGFTAVSQVGSGEKHMTVRRRVKPS